MAGAASSEKKRRKRKKKLAALAQDAAAAGGDGDAELMIDDDDDDDDDDGFDDGALGDLVAHAQKLAIDEEDQSAGAQAETAAGIEGAQRLDEMRIHPTQAATKRDHLMRNRVLLRPEAMAQLGVAPGAKVFVDVAKSDKSSDAAEGSAATSNAKPTRMLASAWPLASLKHNEIQLSKSVRLLAGASPTCSVERAPSEPVPECVSVRMRVQTADIRAEASVRQTLLDEPRAREYVRETLLGESLAPQTACALLLNGYFVNLVAVDLVPRDAPVQLVTRKTNFSFAANSNNGSAPADVEEDSAPAHGFDALVGGLRDQVDQVRQVLSLALEGSGEALPVGVRVPRGVLLHGPPGTGKTLIARSAAREFQASLHVINGAEMVSHFVGQAEARLSAVFEAAFADPPALVFIDEIDALCPARGQSASAESGMAAVHTRIVGVLMQQLDRLARAGRVAVVAASNRPSALDPALRRPGRLDREVEVGVPAAGDRADIMRIHLAEYPNALDSQEIARVAEEMHGFVGADIMALCREAAWQALRRHLRLSKHEDGAIAEQTARDAEGAQITLDDVLEARATIKPSALREFAIEVPKVRWGDVGGQDEVKTLLREAVEPEYHAAFTRMGISPPQGVLLYGPPGCSKTLLAKAIATECKMNFIAIKGPELFNKWVGESERAVHEVFRKARLAEPTVVFFDEIDALAGARGAGSDAGSAGGVADRVLSQLLTEMDGIEARKRVIVVAATNRPDLVDAALLRPGRLDRLILVRPPDVAAREAILRIHTRRMPLDADVDLGLLAASTTEGFTGAEISSLCREAAMHALERDENVQTVANDDFVAAADLIDPQVTEGMLAFYLDLERKLSQGAAH